MCKGKEYNTEKQLCYNDNLLNLLCGSEKYDPEKQFCKGKEILDKCDGKEYNTQTYYCRDNSLLEISKCVGEVLSHQFCYKGKVYEKCGNGSGCVRYNPETHFCMPENTGAEPNCEGYITKLCGGEEYNHFQECVNGKITRDENAQ
jgi:hypothetical protein